MKKQKILRLMISGLPVLSLVSIILNTINDHIGGKIDIGQLLEVISMYINHTPKA